MQRKLIFERDLTLDKAIQLATAMKPSTNAARSMTPQTPAVNAVSRHSNKQQENQPGSGKSRHKCHRRDGLHHPS